MQTSFDEGRHAAEFVMSEANGNRSRENIVVASGAGEFEPGIVLGKRAPAASLSGAVTADAGNTGDGALTLDGVTPFGGAAIPGDYRVFAVEEAADAGAFAVENPNGVMIGSVNAGASFASDEVNFDLADGATDFDAGDGFTITVTATGPMEYVPVDPGATDGTQVACAVALYGGDATSADVSISAIARDATVNGNLLAYDASVDTDAERALIASQLADAGIIVR